MNLTQSADEAAKKTTWAAIAAFLGCSREALDTLRKLPGAPTSRDANEWKGWVEANGHLKGGSRKLADLKVLIAEEELKKKRRENAVAENILIPESVIRDFHQAWASRLDLLLTQELETNAPPLLAGKNIVEIRSLMVEAHDRIRAATSAGLLNWNP